MPPITRLQTVLAHRRRLQFEVQRAVPGTRALREARALRELSVNTNTAALGWHDRALPERHQGPYDTNLPGQYPGPPAEWTPSPVTPVTPGTQDPHHAYVESWTPPDSPVARGLRPVPLFNGTPRTPGTHESPVSVVSPASLVGLPRWGLRLWPNWGRVFPEGARGVDGEILDFLPMRTGWFQCPLTRLWGPATTVVCDPRFSCILCFNEFQEQARCACGPHGNGDGEDRMCCVCVGHLLRQ